jgi:hypothetical protein
MGALKIAERRLDIPVFNSVNLDRIARIRGSTRLSMRRPAVLARRVWERA